jgi:hypothetical protein
MNSMQNGSQTDSEKYKKVAPELEITSFVRYSLVFKWIFKNSQNPA